MANEISNARITGGVKLSGLGNRRNVRDIQVIIIGDSLTFFGKYSSPSLKSHIKYTILAMNEIIL